MLNYTLLEQPTRLLISICYYIVWEESVKIRYSSFIFSTDIDEIWEYSDVVISHGETIIDGVTKIF